MNVLIILNSGQGVSLGVNFTLAANVGVVVPSTATLSELLAGKPVVVDNGATSVTVTSLGVCTNALILPISTTTSTTTIPPTTTTSTTTTSTTSTTTTSTTSTTTTTTLAPAYNYYTFTPCLGGAPSNYRSLLSLALYDVYAFQASPPDRICYTVTDITAPSNVNNLPTIYGPKIDCNDTDCTQP